jgi:hypothetical protein
MEHINRKRKNGREWRVLQEKAQRKTRITVHVGDRVMEVSTYAMQPTRMHRTVKKDKWFEKHKMELDKICYQLGDQ